MKTSIKFSFLFLFTVIACRPSFKNKLNEALYIAGKNKPELEKVIIHYSRNPDDSLKLKAAYFLIENMGNKFGLYPDIKAANKYNVVFERLRALYKNRANTMENRMVINPIIKALWDSIEQKVGDIGIDKKLDCQVIKADYLIENIDYSFKVWYEKPWCRHLSFEQFCESILPYRFKDEPLQYYKKRFYQEFSWIDDSVKDKTDPKEACLIMNRHIAQNFNFSDKLDKYPLRGINDMYNLNGGACIHRYLIVACIMRSLGIPVMREFTPQYCGFPGFHDWFVLIDKSGRTLPFNGGEPEISFPEKKLVPLDRYDKGTKIYRITYKNGFNILQKEISSSFIPETFKEANLIDVTNEYDFQKVDLKFTLEKDIPSKIKYIFLCCFEYSNKSVSVSYAKRNNNQVEFKNVGVNSVYFPAYYSRGNYITMANPKLVNNNGDIYDLNPEFKKTITVELHRKFPPLKKELTKYAKWLYGAKIQASEDILFSKPIVLFEKDTINMDFEYKVIPINSTKSYQFYRLLPKDTSKLYLAELKFITSHSELPFKFIGFTKQTGFNVNTEITRAFDGNIATNANLPEQSWIGVDFGHPVKLSKVEYLIRNDLNVVEIGDDYELLYFNKEWKSLGKQKAGENRLFYKNVPQNALLLLKDLTKGTEERIFIFRDGTQKWL